MSGVGKRGPDKKPRAKKASKPVWSPPKWFMTIPVGSHGSNPVQKRLWKLTSDYVRIFDFYSYGKCVSCWKRMETWKEGQCGHFKPWATCNSYFKYDLMNLALQCPSCNYHSGADTGARFADQMKIRHGKDYLEQIEEENLKMSGRKMYDHELVDLAEGIIELFEQLPEYPDYWGRLMRRYKEYKEEE